MSGKTTLIGAVLVLGGALATGVAHAGDHDAGHRRAAVVAHGQGWSQPAHAAAVAVHGQPPYRTPSRGDRDGDGIADRHDRLHNPPWDRDGDGIPNRHDRLYNPPWDRDGDGIPNGHDRYDDRQGGGPGRHVVPGWQRRS